jgi:hypothetical protein
MFNKELLGCALHDELWSRHKSLEPLADVGRRLNKVVDEFLGGLPSGFQIETEREMEAWVAEVIPPLVEKAGVQKNPLATY